MRIDGGPNVLHRSDVSMKSGLEDRNNFPAYIRPTRWLLRLNEVRPGRPEQCGVSCTLAHDETHGLNEVRPGRPEQCARRYPARPVVLPCLNEVRPGRPEQFLSTLHTLRANTRVSMKSGLEDRNNVSALVQIYERALVSMKSGLEDRNNEWKSGHYAAYLWRSQ